MCWVCNSVGVKITLEKLHPTKYLEIRKISLISISFFNKIKYLHMKSISCSSHRFCLKINGRINELSRSFLIFLLSPPFSRLSTAATLLDCRLMPHCFFLIALLPFKPFKTLVIAFAASCKCLGNCYPMRISRVKWQWKQFARANHVLMCVCIWALQDIVDLWKLLYKSHCESRSSQHFLMKCSFLTALLRLCLLITELVSMIHGF